MWCSNDTFHYMLEAEFVTLVSLKVPSGCQRISYTTGCVEDVTAVYTVVTVSKVDCSTVALPSPPPTPPFLHKKFWGLELLPFVL